MGRYLPGLTLVGVLAVVAKASTTILPSAIGEVTVGVVLGLLVTNLLGLPDAARPGARFALGPLLRIGIVLLGARLSFGAVLDTSLGALLLIVVCLSFALLLVVWLGRRFGLPPRLALLIGVGTAVCGNSAIIATAPVIEADERDVSFAVATITLFGTLAVLLYPFVGAALGLSDRLFGHWAGVAVNDTSQVTATGFAFSSAAGETATIVKLTRNALMGPLIVLIGAIYLRSGGTSGDGDRAIGWRRVARLVPPFVIGFLVMAALNSFGFIPAALSSRCGRPPSGSSWPRWSASASRPTWPRCGRSGCAPSMSASSRPGRWPWSGWGWHRC